MSRLLPLLVSTALPVALLVAANRGSAPPVPCDPDNGGLELPEGFRATVVASQVGAARHLVVAPNGDVFVATAGREGGGVVALRDTSGDGKADVTARFGGDPGTGIALHDGHLWFAPNDRVVRWPWRAGQLEPGGPPDVVVECLPTERSHRAKSIAFGPDGALYVNVGSPSNTCQQDGRQERSPGIDPCPELETRAGIWRFDPNRLGQMQQDGRRWATGMRNTVALTAHPETGRLYAAIHGRDRLASWGFGDTVNAENPAEEFGVVEEGADYGWPYCYFDRAGNAKVLAPEYGGDGKRTDRCADKTKPLVAFPAHWAPNAALFYTGSQFPARFRGGLFVAFHGSWNRAPLPQAGYRVAFVPFADGKPTGPPETFAIKAGDPQGIRPSGLAVGPDGSLYLAADREQTVWRIMRR